MKAADLRKKKDVELVELIDELAAEGMKLRFQRAAMQLASTSRVAQVRREIACIKTIQVERRRQGAEV
jgi:large subunit ribosomal protein L29